MAGRANKMNDPPAMLFDNLLHGSRRFALRLVRALELEEQRVHFWIFAVGEARFVNCGHHMVLLIRTT